MAKAPILIVEDDNSVAQYIQVCVRNGGYSVAGVATTGEEALRRAAEARPALVLMDIHLHGTMDGLAAAAAIRARLDVPIVYLTADAEIETLRGAQLAEPFGYILKPFNARDLWAAIEVALYKHRLEQQLKAKAAVEHESEMHYRIVSELTADYAYVLRVEPVGEPVIEWVSESFTRFMGYTLEEAQALPSWQQLFHADDAPSLRDHMRRMLESHADVREVRVVTRDGAVRYVRELSRPVWDEHQQRVVHIYCAGQDITSRANP
jgi:PAS domain S-box-containing protein